MNQSAAVAHEEGVLVWNCGIAFGVFDTHTRHLQVIEDRPAAEISSVLVEENQDTVGVHVEHVEKLRLVANYRVGERERADSRPVGDTRQDVRRICINRQHARRARYATNATKLPLLRSIARIACDELQTSSDGRHQTTGRGAERHRHARRGHK